MKCIYTRKSPKTVFNYFTVQNKDNRVKVAVDTEGYYIKGKLR